MKPFKSWPLAVATFTLRDKLRIAGRIITSDQYTMGPHVAEFERRMTEFSGMHALGVASGSAANHLVFQLWREKNPHENAVVICPAVTWISAVSPAVMAGFDVKFCDVNKTDLSFDYLALEAMLKKLRRNSRKRIIIWPTALLGYMPHMARLHTLAHRWHAELFMDCCENTMSKMAEHRWAVWDLDAKPDAVDEIISVIPSILSSCDITTTSCYFAHQIQAIEFGFVFLRDAHDYQLARMIRNHGMSRSLTDEEMVREYIAGSWEVDPQFLHPVLGTNYRPSDLNAMFGLCDFERREAAEAHRQKLYSRFRDRMDKSGYFNPPRQPAQSLFCLPIFLPTSNVKNLKKALNAHGVETRPIVGGNLLRQPCFREYGRAMDFPNAEFIHRSGFYVGLHKGVTLRMIDWLCDFLIANMNSGAR